MSENRINSSRVPTSRVSFAEDEVVNSLNNSNSAASTAATNDYKNISHNSVSSINNNNNSGNSSINHPSNPHFPRQVKFEASIVMGDQKQHVTIAEELNERVSPGADPATTEGPPPTTTTEHADSSAQTVPQVMVSYDQYPPVEDHAFRTKIDG